MMGAGSRVVEADVLGPELAGGQGPIILKWTRKAAPGGAAAHYSALWVLSCTILETNRIDSDHLEFRTPANILQT